MAKHSSIVGGSTAARLLNCPGSYQATLKLPPSADISSEYAEEGTFAHEVMTHLMEMRRAAAAHGISPLNSITEARRLPGKTFYDRQITEGHLDTMILPALDALAKLEAEYGGGFRVVAVEQHVTFPGIPGAHGTCDLILANEKVVLHVDWKFGQGVGVKAVYDHGDSETVNAQLMFYTAGSMHSMKSLYRGKELAVLAIIQPRSDTPLSHTAVSRKEVKWFVEDLQAAVVRALDYDPVRQKGEWCRFAPCKLDCPLWTGPMLEIAELKPVPNKDGPVNELLGPTPYGAYLSRAKTLVDLLGMFAKEVNDQLHAYLEAGGQVPGWRLKDKVKNRQWIDEDEVEQALRDLGFEVGEIWRSQLQTFQSVDATAKRLGVVIPDHLRVAPPTTETTVCRTDDPAPPVERRVAIEEFASALKRLA
jgi:hypothetical protein